MPALKGDDAEKYLVAEVVRTVPDRHGDTRVYLIGCRFTGRLDLRKNSPECPAAVG